MAKSTDEQILALIAEVSKRKAEIAKLEKPNWKTNCSFCYTEGSLQGATNLHVEYDITKLVKIAGFLLSQERTFLDAQKALGTLGYKFSWGGFTVEEWVEDIRTRIEKLSITAKRKKLEELESRLNVIITPELKAKLELEAIAAELS